MKITRTINGQEVTIELTPEEMRKAHYEVEKDCLYEDVRQWAEDAGKELDDDLIEDIVGELDKNYDSNSSLWDNISSNYNWFIWLRNK